MGLPVDPVCTLFCSIVAPGILQCPFESFCFVDDLIEGLIRLMNSEYKMPVNLGNPEEYQIFKIAQIISQKTNAELNFVNRPLPKDDPIKRRPVIDIAKKELEWSPMISLDTGLNNTIKYFRNTLSEDC